MSEEIFARPPAPFLINIDFLMAHNNNDDIFDDKTDEKRKGCLFEKCESYWVNGAEAYLHTKISSEKYGEKYEEKDE